MFSSSDSKWHHGKIELTNNGTLSLYKHNDSNKSIDLKIVEFQVRHGQTQSKNVFTPILPGWAYQGMVLNISFTNDSFMVIFRDISKAQ